MLRQLGLEPPPAITRLAARRSTAATGGGSGTPPGEAAPVTPQAAAGRGGLTRRRPGFWHLRPGCPSRLPFPGSHGRACSLSHPELKV